MGILQYADRIDATLAARALAVPFRTPPLDAVRVAIAAHLDPARPGWAVSAVSAVGDGERTLAAELLTGSFPARDEEHAVASARDLARRLLVRDLDRQKSQLLGAIQRVAPESDEGRSVRMRLREIDLERQHLVADS